MLFEMYALDAPKANGNRASDVNRKLDKVEVPERVQVLTPSLRKLAFMSSENSSRFKSYRSKLYGLDIPPAV